LTGLFLERQIRSEGRHERSLLSLEKKAHRPISNKVLSGDWRTPTKRSEWAHWGGFEFGREPELRKRRSRVVC